MLTFSQRLVLRNELWWAKPRWGGKRTYRDAVHRLRERRIFRSRDDPDAAWRCCEFWPRLVLNKWNGREFARKHGCRVPALYWRGSSAVLPFDSLPRHYVIRPVFGANIVGVVAVSDGKEIIWGTAATPAEIAGKMPPPARFTRGVPILIEEFICPEEGRYCLPLEYKCHTFGDTVAAVQVIDRKGVNRARQRFYTTAWEPCTDPMFVGMRQEEVVRDAPAFLEPMLELARTLGHAIGTYMRVDFFGTDRGCVFNEFSSFPAEGLHYTPHCSELFGALWAEKFPRAT